MGDSAGQAAPAGGGLAQGSVLPRYRSEPYQPEADSAPRWDRRRNLALTLVSVWLPYVRITFGTEGRGFESLRARQYHSATNVVNVLNGPRARYA